MSNQLIIEILGRLGYMAIGFLVCVILFINGVI